MSRSAVLTEEMARKAIEIVMPSILAAMNGLTKRDHLAIVIADPCSDKLEPLYEHVIGTREEWEHPYDEIAWKKADLCHRAGRDSDRVKSLSPFLYRWDDPPFAGGIITEDGLIVACSGVEGFFDEMFAWLVAAACIALCKQKMVEIEKKDANSIGAALSQM